MNKLSFLIPFFLILFLTISCQRQSKKSALENVHKSYFDLTQIVQQDVNNNIKNEQSEEKTFFINGKRESKKIIKVDWQKEMEILMECDINKPNWNEKFNVQSFVDEKKIIYTSISSKIPIKKMIVYYAKDTTQITSIEIEKETKSILFYNQQHIVYIPTQSFKIKSTQRALFMKDFNTEVEVKY